MTLKNFVSFIVSLLTTFFSYCIIFLIIVFSTFSLSGQTLSEKENQDTFFFYTAFVVTTTTIYIVIKQWKTSQKYSAAGIAIPLLFALYGCFMLGQVYFDNLIYHENFDSNIWKQAKVKPFKMAKTLVKEKSLFGKTKESIVNELGVTGDSIKNDRIDLLKYWTDNDTWELRIYFKNDKVSDAYLYEEGLDL